MSCTFTPLTKLKGKPYEHETTTDGQYDPNGVINRQTQQMEGHTRELQKPQ